MSILSSTKSGIKAFKFKAEDFLERGFTRGKFTPDIDDTLWQIGNSEHRIYYDQNEGSYFITMWNLSKFYINNPEDLKLLLKYWSAKNEKEKAKAKKKIFRHVLGDDWKEKQTNSSFEIHARVPKNMLWSTAFSTVK